MATTVAERSGDTRKHPGRRVVLRDTTYDVIAPTWGDPRLVLSATIIALQVLGQTVLDFDVSITQILLAIGSAALVEGILALRFRHQILWPASAIQTGNGIGLIMRVPGTEHGDWWSTRGWSLFVGVAAFSIFSKYAIQWGDRHLFNPSNLGLVTAFVVLGTTWVDPQPLWWGPLSGPVIAALVVIAFGGVFATYRAGVLRVSLSFFLPFAALLAILSASGHWMVARWSVEPIVDWHYWLIVVTSPEILVLVLFMITDPRTIPKGETARTAFGIVMAVVATLLIAPAHTEFWTKVNVLAALVICCALRPAFERWIPVDTPMPSELWRRWFRAPRVLAAGIAALAIVTGLIVCLGNPARDVTDSALGIVTPGSDGQRPDIKVPDEVPVTLSQSPQVSGTVDADVARRAANDVMANIAIEADALQRGDSSLGATALFGDQLERLQATIAGGGAIEVTTVDPDHVAVLWVRGTFGPQAPPQIAVTVWGTATTTQFFNGEAVGEPVTSGFSRT